MKKLTIAALSLLLLTNCMQSEGNTSGQSTSDPVYNQDTRTPEPSDSMGGHQDPPTHKPNTGPDNDSDSMP